jgi:hypothetical protein
LDSNGKIIESGSDIKSGFPPSINPYAISKTSNKLAIIGSIIDDNDNTKNNIKIVYFDYSR